jgi:hypothetical protein
MSAHVRHRAAIAKGALAMAGAATRGSASSALRSAHTNYTLPFWAKVEVLPDRDISLLRAEPLKGRTAFESHETALKYNDLLIERLGNRALAVQAILERCNARADFCGLPNCAKCARFYRRYFVSELLRVGRQCRRRCQTATILLEIIDFGRLSQTNMAAAHDRLRKRLQRCGFSGSIIIGGTELTWIENSLHWILHVHVLAIGASDDSWKRLKKIYRDDVTKRRGRTSGRTTASVSGRFRPVVVKSLRHPLTQCSYLLKFQTIHRPGTQHGARRPSAVPMREGPLVELVEWRMNYQLDDFLFLFGARRRGGKIVPIDDR